MDFHSLVRKDLQTLCKLNKIPANRTNIAMAEALYSLQIVKGIEKFYKSTESSSVAESSIESPEKNVVTSPKTTRTGRRKQGSGIVQTATPVTRRRNKFPVASVKTVQTVYNTRLSARLSKNKVLDSENKKECIEVVKISSYCNGVCDNDFGEVSEDKECTEAIKINSICDGICANDFGEVSDDKGLTGFDNNTVHDLCVSEIEQQSESLKWNNDDEDLNSKDTATTSLKSKVLKNKVEGFQMDSVEAVVEMSSHNNMAVVGTTLHKQKDDVGVDLCLSETDIITEVLENEGEMLQMETEKAVGERPAHENKAAIPIFYVQEKGYDDVELDSFFSETELQIEPSKRGDDENLSDVTIGTTEMKEEALNSKGSRNLKVDFSVPEIEQRSESQNLKYADRDLDEKDTAATNLKCEVLINMGSQMDTVKAVVDVPSYDNKAVVDMPSYDNKAVVDMLLHKMRDDVGVDLSLSKINMTTEVQTNEVKLLQMDTEKAVVEMPIHESKAVIQILSLQKKDPSRRSDDVGVDSSFSETELSVESSKRKNRTNLESKFAGLTEMKAEVLNSKGTDNVRGLLFLFETEQQTESLNWENADKDLDSKDMATTNLKSEVLINKVEGFHINTVKAKSEMLSHDNRAALNTPQHNLNAKVLQPKSENIVFESESSAANVFVNGENSDICVKIQQDISSNAKSGGVNDNEKGLPSQEGIISQSVALDLKTKSESYEGTQNSSCNNFGDNNSADTDFFLHLIFPDETDHVSFEMDTENSLADSPVHERNAAVQTLFLQKKGSDDFEVNFSFSETELQIEPSKRENDDNLDDDDDTSGSTDMKAEVINTDSESPKKHLKLESSEEFIYGECVQDLMIQPKSDNIVLDSRSSAANIFVNGRNTDIIMKTQQDISCNVKSGAVCDNEKGLSSQEEISGKVIASDDTEFFLRMIFSEMSDNETDHVSTEMDTEKALAVTPVHERNTAVPNLFLQKKVSDDDDTGGSADMKAEVLNSKESESPKEHLKLESSEEFIYGECVQDLMIQPKSDNFVFDSRSSAANIFVAGENSEINVKIQNDVSGNAKSGGAYDSKKGLQIEEGIIGQAVASDLKISSESYEGTENLSCNNFNDNNSAETDFFPHMIFSETSDNVTDHVSSEMDTETALAETPVLERNAAVQILFLHNKGSDDVEVNFPFSETKIQIENSKRENYENLDDDITGGLTDMKAEVLDSQDSESPKEHLKLDSSEEFIYSECVYDLMNQPKLENIVFESRSSAANISVDGENSDIRVKIQQDIICNAESGGVYDYEKGHPSQEEMDSKKESIASPILGGTYIKEYTDQSATPYSSLYSSVGSSSGIITSEQLDSGKSFTKESRLLVASDVSPCCLGISLDDSQQACEVKSSSSLKLSGKICPFSAPLQTRSLQKRRHIKDMPVSSVTNRPTFKLTSNVLDDKENIEQNESKGNLTKEKANGNKNEPVCEKYEVGLLVRSPKKQANV